LAIQLARELAWELDETRHRFMYLIRDPDAKFTDAPRRRSRLDRDRPGQDSAAGT